MALVQPDRVVDDETVIPRLYFQFNSSDQLALHVFVDASMKAYGAVTYVPFP